MSVVASSRNRLECASVLVAIAALMFSSEQPTAAPLFRAPSLLFDAGNHPYSVAIADLNGDDRLDVVTANGDTSTVSVLLGRGDGTFGAHTDFFTAGPPFFGVGSGPGSVAIADVNGDGRPDLIAAVHEASVISVLLGNGDGTFQAHVDYARTGG